MDRIPVHNPSVRARGTLERGITVTARGRLEHGITVTARRRLEHGITVTARGRRSMVSLRHEHSTGNTDSPGSLPSRASD